MNNNNNNNSLFYSHSVECLFHIFTRRIIRGKQIPKLLTVLVITDDHLVRGVYVEMTCVQEHNEHFICGIKHFIKRSNTHRDIPLHLISVG